MFWVLKRTVSLKRFFEHPQHMFWMRNREKNSNTHSYLDAWNFSQYETIY